MNVTIAGGGLIGLCSAYYLASAGATVPALRLSDTPLPTARTVAAADQVAAFNPKILIIDDNRDAADSLHALLREHGFSCASALRLFASSYPFFRWA